MKVKVITLDEQGARFQNFKKRAEMYGIEYEVFPGVEYKDELAFRVKTGMLPGTTKGMVACTIAHMNLMEQLAESNENWAVFEDDASFLPNVDLEYANDQLSTSIYHFLHLHGNSFLSYSNQVEGITRMKHHSHISTCAYIMTPNTARKFLAMCEKNDKKELIAPIIIDKWHNMANVNNIRGAFLFPLMVSHAGMQSLIKSSDYIVPPIPPVPPTFEEHKENAFKIAREKLHDNTIEGIIVDGIKFKLTPEALANYKEDYLLLRTEDEFVRGNELKHRTYYLYDYKQRQIKMTGDKYLDFLKKVLIQYSRIKYNIKRREVAVSEATTFEQILEANKIHPLE